eukprot:SM000134S26920  [mRNA]  locus=s134:10968:12934:+ [translate_table: standard]
MVAPALAAVPTVWPVRQWDPAAGAAVEFRRRLGGDGCFSTQVLRKLHRCMAGAMSLPAVPLRQPQQRPHCKTTTIAAAAKGKGFGELLRQRRRADDGGVGVGEGVTGEAVATAAAAEGEAGSRPCPCGGGAERLPYDQCCRRFHGGAVEPDALTLMTPCCCGLTVVMDPDELSGLLAPPLAAAAEARYSAYAKGVVPYIVRTTHLDNPDVAERGGSLAADAETTCKQLVFKRLEFRDHTLTPTSADEDYVSFRVTYSMAKAGNRGEDKVLIETSRFLRSEGRWLYREKLTTDITSDKGWENAIWMQDERAPRKQARTYNTKKK